MTTNRTSLQLFSALGTQLIVVLIVALATFLTLSRYFWMAGEQMRRFELKARRRALRRIAA